MSAPKKRYVRGGEQKGDAFLAEALGGLAVTDRPFEAHVHPCHDFEDEVVFAVAKEMCVTWNSKDGLLYAYHLQQDSSARHRVQLQKSHGFAPATIPLMDIYHDPTFRRPGLRNNVLVTVNEHNTIDVWDLTNGAHLVQMHLGACAAATSVAISPRYVAVAHPIPPTDGSNRITSCRINILPWVYYEPMGNILTTDVHVAEIMALWMKTDSLLYIGSSGGLLNINIVADEHRLAAVQCVDETICTRWPCTTQERMQAHAWYANMQEMATAFFDVPGDMDDYVSVKPCAEILPVRARVYPQPAQHANSIISVHDDGVHTTAVLTNQEALFINHTTRTLLPVPFDNGLSVCTDTRGFCYALNQCMGLTVINGFSKATKPDVIHLYIDDGVKDGKQTDAMTTQHMMSPTKDGVYIHNYSSVLLRVTVTEKISEETATV